MRVTGALLVGGASRRFGSPKALAEIAWERLAWCDERLALGKGADSLALPFPVADDGSDVRAPIAGVVGALRLARNDVCVVVPVDMPGLTEDALRRLADTCRDAAVPQTGPLPGAYRRTALPALEEALAAGRLRLREALAGLDVAVVDLPPEVLANVNEPADLPL